MAQHSLSLSPRRAAPKSLRSPRPDPSARSPWAWGIAGAIVGAAVALLALLPASWLASAVQQATGLHVQLAAARGTVWNGSAQLVLSGGSDSQTASALPGRIHWTVRPSWRGVRAQLSLDCCTQKPLAMSAQPRWGGVRLAVEDGESRWPATVLAGLGTPFNTLQFQGQLALQTRGLVVESVAGRPVLAGNARLDALGMSSRLSTLRPLGSYRLDLSGGEAPALQLSTLSGALQMSGHGQWVGQRLRFTGEAQAAPGREEALSNLLNIIGQRNGARSLISLG